MQETMVLMLKMGRLKDGKLAAIKVLSAESRQGVKEFLTEIEVISKIEHENLVKLYGCCGGHAYSSIQFSWQTRYKICVGVARGLAFLHEEVQPYIVHRDIKASNILLDRDLTPKISDFGLAKLIPSNMTHVSTRVAGTILAFSLLEILFSTSSAKLTWHFYERKELIGLVDSSMNGDFDAEEACRFLKIGLLCTQDAPKLRPTMSTVVKMLTGEIEVYDSRITKPGLITDFMDLKVRGPQKTSKLHSSDSDNTTSSSYNLPSTSEKLDGSTMFSDSAAATMSTFTSPYDQSIVTKEFSV
ncbi:hypothetical protein F8388_006567 [Cannabis sativa]|uniref:non-specific serine/threonine protein kinase n=1 Tax=Cannabis sativa TaxID=3483 RepID=A0A7J6GUJ8_CANSA|nr:hypothetical protein F8388_006567 [Cannabis sativa]